MYEPRWYADRALDRRLIHIVYSFSNMVVYEVRAQIPVSPVHGSRARRELNFSPYQGWIAQLYTV